MNNESRLKRILLGHGSGGVLMHDLIKRTIMSGLNLKEARYDDSAIIDINGERFAFTTDSYVVDPLFFPGGNIGDLAINGTVNDLAVMGARPLFISLSFILEEGFETDKFDTILSSIEKTARKSGVEIITGDTKVVNKGKGDGIFINTSGIGMIESGVEISGSNAKVGDKIIISGPIGNHGIAVIAERNGIKLEPPIKSDTAPLNLLTMDMLKATKNIHAMRDPTRGGIATTLKEIAVASGVCIEIYEDKIPIEDGIRAACELLGFEPFYVANEGILVAFVPEGDAERVLDVMRKNHLGKNAEIIGEVKENPKKMVLLKTSIGGTRIIDMLTGEQLPRIC
ncbi:MAG: hydrogenase expression/formation protein HypE [Nitrospirota bacterium]|mgnify:FL=1|jgi:hydrogenase expression/formation protein HypE